MKDKATAAAGSTMSLLASIGAVFSSKLERFDSPAEKVGLILVGAIGLYTVFELVQWLFLRFRYRRLLGRWYYATREHEGVRFADRNVAVMDFNLSRDGDLTYCVFLYPTSAALTAAIRGRRRPEAGTQRGSAHSIALSYDVARNKVEVLFAVCYTTGRLEDCSRSGILTLEFKLDGTMNGEYVSQIWEFGEGKPARGLSSGVMFATRKLADLKAHLTPAAGSRTLSSGPAPPKRARRKSKQPD